MLLKELATCLWSKAMLWALLGLFLVDSANPQALFSLDRLPDSSETYFERPADI